MMQSNDPYEVSQIVSEIQVKIQIYITLISKCNLVILFKSYKFGETLIQLTINEHNRPLRNYHKYKPGESVKSNLYGKPKDY